jgi:hypothetical protein
MDEVECRQDERENSLLKTRVVKTPHLDEGVWPSHDVPELLWRMQLHGEVQPPLAWRTAQKIL